MPTVPMTPAPTPESRIRIIALGDELLAGVGDARALGWLGRAVASEQGADSRIDVFAAALPGETSAELADRWDAEVHRRLSAEGQADGSVDHRIVLALGRGDVPAGISLARSRLNLAKVLDGLERLRLPAFVVGPAPSADSGTTAAVRELSAAFEDVCSRRRIPYVDTVGGLVGHDQWESDLARSAGDHPGQTGYGLIAWLVLHAGFGRWLGTSS
ncbi:GDSL-type esterase/lipase family protein [Brachybacterium saurashtrense]|uniref:Lysophospholipase n=1 Tax=Brachybacterium saurashtrense TaxID=556288 RepID=A0A345YNB4_9MICO|nr:GDSL-type esterase/lipase family protein [Brachybacterium saurashtrense]AXK45416.1 lysophospholipase [Brachybacterium saurashtrense]RRR21827.1 lysophospholipase [Brachybacterium saurashtrense]